MPNVLITGAGRGIGRATALRLADAGWAVIAGVRKAADGEALVRDHPANLSWVELDVTDDAHIAALETSLPATLDAVVNNAGIVVGGPVEAVPAAELRRQLEVNIVGQVAVAQATLPRLRASRGRLVFVSSVSGQVATPMSGAYNASKFGLEGLVDALRMEVAPWGIRVAIVEPAQTDTDMWRSADTEFDTGVAGLSAEHRALYAQHLDGFRKTIPRNQKVAKPVETVAEVIERALTAQRPRARYVVGRAARAQVLMARLAPTRLRDAAIGMGSGVPRRIKG